MSVVADQVIVELEAKLGRYEANVAKAETTFTRSMGNIEKSAGTTERSLSKSFAAMSARAAAFAATGAAALGVALAGIVVSAVRAAGEIKKTSEALGISSTALQEYRYAADSVGVSQDALNDGFKRLNDLIGKASLGAKQPSKIFQALGIDIRDAAGNVRDASSVLPELADRLNAIEDPAQRAATAALIFGDKAAELKPLLEQGSKGMDGLREAAQRLGVVLSERQIQEADKVAKKLDDLKLVLSSNITAAVVANADAIIQLANSLSTLVDWALKAVSAYSEFKRSTAGGIVLSAIKGATNPVGFAVDRATSAYDMLRGNRKAVAPSFDPLGSAMDLFRQNQKVASKNPPNVGSLLAPEPKKLRTPKGKQVQTLEEWLNATAIEVSNDVLKQSNRGSEDFNRNSSQAYDEAMREVEKRLEAERELKREIDDEAFRRQEDQITTLANLYEDGFRRGTKGIWDDFKQIGTRIIAEVLARFTMSQIGGGGFSLGGALTSAIGHVLPGFAGGGSGIIGGRGGTDNNVLSLNGKPFANVSRGERMSIENRAISKGGAGGTIIQNFSIDARSSVTPDDFARRILSVSNQQAQQAAATMGQGVIKAMPARLAQYQTDGT